MKRSIFFLLFISCLYCTFASAESSYTIFDDKMLLDGYATKYQEEPKEILLAIIQDDTLTSYKTAAAVRVFKENFSSNVFAKERHLIEKILLRRLNRTESPFVQIEIMHTLLKMDRYKYFKSMIPDLIQELDHYNKTVNDLSYTAIDDIIKSGHNRPREARLVFNTLRKILFLSRKRLQNIKEPNEKLQHKLDILRWAVKILGTQELKRLPPEVINLF
ncbi:MAG: hypothetical protein ABIJ41_07245 [Candidatus Omnitrophota bacterium]